MAKTCIVLNCRNTSDEYKFVGDLCFPCHAYITGKGGEGSQVHQNAAIDSACLTPTQLFERVVQRLIHEPGEVLVCKTTDTDDFVAIWYPTRSKSLYFRFLLVDGEIRVDSNLTRPDWDPRQAEPECDDGD